MKVFERVVVEINHKSSTCGAEQEGVGYSTDKITKRDKWKGAGINKNSMCTGTGCTGNDEVLHVKKNTD